VPASSATLPEDQVQPAFVQLPEQHFAQRHREFEIHERMAPAEFAQNSRKLVQNQIFGCPEPDATPHTGLREVTLGVRVPLEYRGRETDHDGAVRGQLDRVRIPQKQAAPGRQFQLSHMLTDRRLSQAQSPGRGGETSGARDSEKAPQMNRIEHLPLLSRFSITVNAPIVFRNIRTFLTVKPC
jgi:hypothetical protein